jgi:uncharacterized membrane protein
MSRERWMALSFAIGSLCFLVGPFPGYAELVGAEADAVTFFVGSIFFTVGGALQVSLSGAGPDRQAAIIQSAGTLFFNVTTFMALHTSVSNPDYDRLVWRPDALGSVCFLVSGVIAYRARRTGDGWEPAVNLLGCVFFGISAVAGYVVPSRGSILDLAAANWNTALGAACFLACAVATLRSGRTMKSPRLRRLHHLEERVEERLASAHRRPDTGR